MIDNVATITTFVIADISLIQSHSKFENANLENYIIEKSQKVTRSIPCQSYIKFENET